MQRKKKGTKQDPVSGDLGSANRVASAFDGVQQYRQTISREITPNKKLRTLSASPVRQGLSVIERSSTTWSLPTITCLNVGLDPKQSSSAPYVCDGCKYFFGNTLGGNINNNNEYVRAAREKCERP